MTANGIHLVLGGARSGKTRFALDLAQSAKAKPIYVATGTAFDDEMRDRIARHVEERGPEWTTLEEPLGLPAVIMRHARPETILLVDCLTLWLNNLMYHERDVAAATTALGETLKMAKGRVILVSTEIGFGLVPETPLGRAFRDAQGRLNQSIAKVASHATLVVAGLPVVLKAPSD